MTYDLSASLEDYLEAIFELQGTKGVARVRDIAAQKSVSMPSVNGAIKRLAKQELVKHSRYEYVELTPQGELIAKEVANRHALLKCFMTDILHVDEKTADSDACAIEHHVSQKTVQAMLRFLDALPDGECRSFRSI